MDSRTALTAKLEDFRPVHVQIMLFGVGRQRQKGAHFRVILRFAIELFVEAGGDERGQDAVAVAGTDHHRPGPVPEEQTGRPVGPVDKAGADIRADDQGRFALRGHQPFGHVQGVIEAAATGLDVEGRGLAVQPQFVLDLDGAGREKIGRGVGPHDDVTQLLRLNPGGRQGLSGGEHRHADRIFIRGANTSLVDAAAFHDPFVVRGHHLFQVLIGQDRFRQIAPGAQDTDFMLAQGCS